MISALFFFQPGRYVLGNTLTRIWNYSLMAVCMIYIAIFVLRFRFAEVKKSDLGVGLLLAAHIYSLLIASLLNAGTCNLKNALIYTVTLLGFTAFVRTGLMNNAKAFLQGFLISGLLQSLIHLATMILYHSNGGMRKGISVLGRSYSDNWFYLGHANASFFIIFPVIVVMFVYAYQFNIRIIKYCWAVMAAILVCFLIQYSLAGLLGFVLFAGILAADGLFPAGFVQKVCRWLNLRVILVATLIMESFLALMTGLSRYSEFLYDKFSKGQSIGARLRIWGNTLSYILAKPLTGNGLNTEEAATLRLTNTHTHNILLEFLYCGGLIALVLFVAAILYLQNYLDRNGEKLYRNKAFRTAMWAIIPFITAATFDYYIYRHHQLILYILLWHLPGWLRKEQS